MLTSVHFVSYMLIHVRTLHAPVLDLHVNHDASVAHVAAMLAPRIGLLSSRHYVG